MAQWDFPGRRGRVPLPAVTRSEDAEVLCGVVSGEAPVIVAAYEVAAGLAESLWDELERAGLGREVVRVVPSLTDDLRPVVRVQLTAEGARQAGWLFGGDAGAPGETGLDHDSGWPAA